MKAANFREIDIRECRLGDRIADLCGHELTGKERRPDGRTNLIVADEQGKRHGAVWWTQTIRVLI